MKEYSAYFIFKSLSQDNFGKLSELNNRYGFEVDYDTTFLEFEYSGRDTSLNVVKYLYELAKIVKNADGELVCEVVNDEGDNEFGFYSIEHSKLIIQLGKIVRGEKEVVVERNIWGQSKENIIFGVRVKTPTKKRTKKTQ